jgi:catechol 2,3-dioxygenase-like lactoylglutathione lyase family enzyme
MNILAIDHVQLAIPVGGEEKARDFYLDVLGFTEVPKPAALAGRGGLWVESGIVQVHLGVENDFRPARKAHPAFLVDNLARLHEKIKDSGLEFDDSQPPLDGYLRLHVYDPFGNRIELMQRI